MMSTPPGLSVTTIHDVSHCSLPKPGERQLSARRASLPTALEAEEATKLPTFIGGVYRQSTTHHEEGPASPYQSTVARHNHSPRRATAVTSHRTVNR
jgi:hypothetical protein